MSRSALFRLTYYIQYNIPRLLSVALWRFEWEAAPCAELMAHIERENERDRGEERKGNTPKCPPPSLLLSFSPQRSQLWVSHSNWLNNQTANARYNYCMKHHSGLQRFLCKMWFILFSNRTESKELNWNLVNSVIKIWLNQLIWLKLKLSQIFIICPL